jgi:hypothetical protein
MHDWAHSHRRGESSRQRGQERDRGDDRGKKPGKGFGDFFRETFTDPRIEQIEQRLAGLRRRLEALTSEALTEYNAAIGDIDAFRTIYPENPLIANQESRARSLYNNMTGYQFGREWDSLFEQQVREKSKYKRSVLDRHLEQREQLLYTWEARVATLEARDEQGQVTNQELRAEWNSFRSTLIDEQWQARRTEASRRMTDLRSWHANLTRWANENSNEDTHYVNGWQRRVNRYYPDNRGNNDAIANDQRIAITQLRDNQRTQVGELTTTFNNELADLRARYYTDNQRQSNIDLLDNEAFLSEWEGETYNLQTIQAAAWQELRFAQATGRGEDPHPPAYT